MNLDQRTAIVIITLLSLVILPVGVGVYLFTGSSALPLALSLSGGVTDAPNQQYLIQGGNFVNGTILGHPIDPKSAELNYSMYALVSGLSSTGETSLNLTAMTLDGKSVTLEASGFVSGVIPAIQFPTGCTLKCTSEIPASFISLSNASVSIGGSINKTTIPIGFESAYLNPFGGPLVIASNDGNIVIIANYSVAKILWQSVQMPGTVAGNIRTANNPAVTGSFQMNITSVEDLFSGTEYDHGTVALVGMNPSKLNSTGTFSGDSTIPKSGAQSCPSTLGFPTGTCTMTGLQSTGNLTLISKSGSHIRGTYETSWSVPAISYSGNVTATEQ